MPCRRAVEETCRDPLRLSATIRSFSSSFQRRRRPVSTTSTRSNTGLDVRTAIRSVLYPHRSANKAALGGGVPLIPPGIALFGTDGDDVLVGDDGADSPIR